MFQLGDKARYKLAEFRNISRQIGDGGDTWGTVVAVDGDEITVRFRPTLAYQKASGHRFIECTCPSRQWVGVATSGVAIVTRSGGAK